MINSLVLLGLGALLFALNFVSDLHSPTLFVIKASLQPSTVLALIALIIYACCKKTKLTTIAVLLVCLINTPFLLPKNAPQSPAVNASSLTAATFSTLTRTDNVEDITRFIRMENPDVLCLQEVSLNHRQQLRKQLDGHYAYQIQNNNNQVTLSHYPLTLDNDQGHILATKLEHPQWGLVNVINTHMPRPYLEGGLTGSWGLLLEQLDTQSKILLCGDLNITPNNSLYDVLIYRYNLHDSLASGYGFTFPNAQRKSALLGPLIRIDYVLTRGFSTTNTTTINASSLSDHRAVITEITLDLSENE